MAERNRQALAERVARAATTALESQGSVTAIDVMLGLRWLSPSCLVEWRTRRLPALQHAIQTDPKRVRLALRLFREWAQQAELEPAEADYVARTPNRERLQFSLSGAAALEAAWRTQWISPRLSTAQRGRVRANAQKPPELVVVMALHPDWECHHCGGSGALLVMEPPGPACLPCVGLDHLELLPAGDALLTRRARAASKQTAVVVRWSKARKRNERVGCLVEHEALASARARIERESAQ